MFWRPRVLPVPLILIAVLGLAACNSPLGPKSTPTPLPPTATPVPPTATPEPAAATVNGEIISIADYRAELARYQSAQQAMGRTVGEAEAGETVLEDLIDQVLLAQAARAAGYELSETELQARIDGLAAARGGSDQLAVWETAHGYSGQEFERALKRSIEAAWMRDKIIAEVPASAEQVRLQQILVYDPEAANQALARLKNGADFADLAASYDPVTHGELGWVPMGYLLDAKVEAAAFALQPGTYSEIIASDVGYHILKVIERGEHPLSPDALLVLQELFLRDWVAQQRAGSAIQLTP